HATVNNYKYTLTKTSTSGNPYIRVSDEIFEDDTEYVVTFKIRKISGNVNYMGGHSTVAVHNSTKIYLDGELVTEGGNGWSNNDRDSVYPNDDETHQYMIKFRTRSDVASDPNARWYIQPNRPIYGSDFVVEIWDWQIEKGNKATDWSPSPEDVESRLSKAEATIETTVEGIKLLATKDEVNKKVDTNTYNSKMSSLDTTIKGINAKVESTETSIN